MELRSSCSKNEYKELQTTLSCMGIYEEGMELQEMREVLDALQISATECETNFIDTDLQQALGESELNFVPSPDDRVLNSTMMSTHHDIPPSSTGNISSDIITVRADVHHAMDWSPPSESSPRKRFASPKMAVDNETTAAEFEIIEPDINRRADIVEQNPNNSAANSLQISTSSTGIISEHRVNDSGLIMNPETQHSSFSNTSSNVVQASTASLNTLENRTPEVPENVHEIIGPVSVRRIHDSGVNISTDASQTSVLNNSNDNSSCSVDFNEQ